MYTEGASLVLRDEQQVQQAREHVDAPHSTFPGSTTHLSRDGGNLGCASVRSDAGGFVDPPRYLYALREELEATGRVRGFAGDEDIDVDAGAAQRRRRRRKRSAGDERRRTGSQGSGRLRGSAQARDAATPDVTELCDPANTVVLCTGAYGGHLLQSLGTAAASSVAQRLTPAWGWCATTTASQREVLDVPGGKVAGIVGDATQYVRRNTEDDGHTLLDDGSMKLAGGLGFHLGTQMMQWALDVMPKHCRVMGMWGVIASSVPEVRLWCGARSWLTVHHDLTSRPPRIVAAGSGYSG